MLSELLEAYDSLFLYTSGHLFHSGITILLDAPVLLHKFIWMMNNGLRKNMSTAHGKQILVTTGIGTVIWIHRNHPWPTTNSLSHTKRNKTDIWKKVGTIQKYNYYSYKYDIKLPKTRMIKFFLVCSLWNMRNTPLFSG